MRMLVLYCILKHLTPYCITLLSVIRAQASYELKYIDMFYQIKQVERNHVFTGLKISILCNYNVKNI